MTRVVNSFKTSILMALLMGLAIAAGYVITGNQSGIVFGLLFGGVGVWISYFFSDKIALSSMRAQQVGREDAPDLYTMVERLARNANLPMPKVYICPTMAPNAFATGRNPNNAAVAVTRGALQMLTYDELEGVMAHELAHVKNRDTLISCVAATIAGALNAMGWLVFLGGGNRDVHPLLLLAMVLLAPIAAAVVQMAISRSREFVADHDAAYIAGTPEGLISALRKLEAQAQRVPMENEAPSSNHMFIVQPLNAKAMSGLSQLFSTHPSTDKRVAKLEALRGSIR